MKEKPYRVIYREDGTNKKWECEAPDIGTALAYAEAGVEGLRACQIVAVYYIGELALCDVRE